MSHQPVSNLFVLFPDGAKFPIRYYLTSDCYTVEVPAGTYEAEYLGDLTKLLRKEFLGVRITK
jgi:hypothetical protein